mgnify:CR=1 FL=1
MLVLRAKFSILYFLESLYSTVVVSHGLVTGKQRPIQVERGEGEWEWQLSSDSSASMLAVKPTVFKYTDPDPTQTFGAGFTFLVLISPCNNTGHRAGVREGRP